MNTYLRSLFLLVLLGYSSTASAQGGTQTMGLRAGASFHKYSYTPDAPSSFTIGYNSGIAVGLEVNHWFSQSLVLGTQLLYIQKGVAQEFRDEGLTYDYDITASYLEIPIYIKHSMGNKAVRPYVFAGPAVGLFLTANSNVRVANVDTTVSMKDEFHETDFCVNVGAGLNAKVSETMDIVLDATYSVGLIDVGKPMGDAFSRGIRVLGGVLLRFRN